MIFFLAKWGRLGPPNTYTTDSPGFNGKATDSMHGLIGTVTIYDKSITSDLKRPGASFEGAGGHVVPQVKKKKEKKKEKNSLSLQRKKEKKPERKKDREL